MRPPATGCPKPLFPHVCAHSFARAVSKSGLRARGHVAHTARIVVFVMLNVFQPNACPEGSFA
eukprot:8965414-Prorocentrum_lima.AAC.1